METAGSDTRCAAWPSHGARVNVTRCKRLAIGRRVQLMDARLRATAPTSQATVGDRHRRRRGRGGRARHRGARPALRRRRPGARRPDLGAPAVRPGAGTAGGRRDHGRRGARAGRPAGRTRHPPARSGRVLRGIADGRVPRPAHAVDRHQRRPGPRRRRARAGDRGVEVRPARPRRRRRRRGRARRRARTPQPPVRRGDARRRRAALLARAAGVARDLRDWVRCRADAEPRCSRGCQRSPPPGACAGPAA